MKVFVQARISKFGKNLRHPHHKILFAGNIGINLISMKGET